MEILPVPVAEAREYLDGEVFEKYKEAYESFYSNNPDYSLIDIALRFFLPKDCEAAKDLAIKRYQVRVKELDTTINRWTESLLHASSPAMKSSFMDYIRDGENTKKVAREEAMQYGAEIPG